MFTQQLKRIATRFGLAACLLGSVLLPGTAQAQENGTVVEGNNRFAFGLYQKISAAQNGDNLLFSPLSVSAALGMTYAGSRGNTAKQMAEAMHFSSDQQSFHREFSALLASLAAADKPYTLRLANALWGQENYPFAQNFIATLADSYQGGFKRLDFINQREASRQVINQWVSGVTNEKVKELLAPADLSADTRLVLTNAVYFKGDWAAPFQQEQTVPQAFSLKPDEQVIVPMMRQTGCFPYADTGEAQLVELPYAGGELSLVALLPQDSPADFAQNLSADKLQQWLAQARVTRVAVLLPRFKVAARYYLEEKQFLPALGLVDAFDKQSADFSGMTGGKDLYLAHVVHQAVIEVNEAGSEAAAATAAVMDTKSMVPVFRADRPFVFLLLHKPSGAILFLGQVNNPAAT